jgi:penicillin-binding protein 1A
VYRAPQFHGVLRPAPAPAPLPPVAVQPLPYVPVPPPTIDMETEPPRRSLLWWAVKWLVILGIWGTVAGLALLLWFARDLPRPESALEAVRRPSLTLQDRAGRVIATYGDVVGQPVHLNELPAYLPAAVVAVEDRRFWTHGAIDPWGMARALLVDLRAGHVVQGGSTLAQQVAKNLFLSNARTFRRKVQELLLSFWLEEHFTKRQILEIWLNRVYLGAARDAVAGGGPGWPPPRAVAL